jgi:hypothetical protein
MATPQVRTPYQGPRYSIRKDDAPYNGPRYAVTPGGVPVQEYPKFAVAAAPADGGSGGEPPAPPPPPIHLPVFNGDSYPVEPESADATMSDPRSGYRPPVDAEEASNMAYDRLLTDPVVDQNGRGKSALMGLGAPVAPSNSLGYVTGERLANGLNGLINPKLDEEAERQQKIQRQTVARKARQQDAEAQAKVGLTNAQAANQAALPVWRDEKQRQDAEKANNTSLDQRRKVLASMLNKMDDFDPDDPANADFVEQARELNMPVVAKKKGEKATYKQDAKTGSWYVFRGDQAANVKAPGSETPLATTSTAQMSAEQGDKNRQNRVEVAKIMVNSREQIAAQQQAIEKDRVQMSKDQFALRYPGAGKVLKRDAIIDKYNKLKAADPMLTIDKVISDATKQGYTIQD